MWMCGYIATVVPSSSLDFQSFSIFPQVIVLVLSPSQGQLNETPKILVDNHWYYCSVVPRLGSPLRVSNDRAGDDF